MFYCYDQNNSGGGFIVDKNVCHHVIIEADSPEEADEKALSIGIYFNGCDEGMDCDCCGDRWYPVSSYSEPTETPQIYGKSPEDYKEMFAKKNEVYCRVYYKNGKWVNHKKKG